MTLLLALLAPACAGGPRIPLTRLAGWHAVEAGDTRLIGDLAPEELQTLAGDLARFEAIFAKLAGWPGAASATPLTIYLFRGREIADRFGLGRRAAGWALETLDQSVITAQITSGQDSDRILLFHEITHVLLARDRRAPLPAWYQEGLATYFSTVSWRDGATVVGAAPITAAAWLMTRGALPLDRLFTASTVRMNHDEILDFYATSWALSHYLLSSPSGRRQLTAFVNDLARGVPSDRAQSAAFDRSLDRLGQELTAHVGHLARGVPIETLFDAGEFAAPPPPPAVALAPGEVAYALGCLALAMVEAGGADAWRQGPGLARSFLARAIAEHAPDAPRVEAALGEARAVGGDTTGGATAVQAALASAPDDPNVRLRAARVALLRAQAETRSGSSPAFADAEKRFLHTLTLAPESASAWFGLGQALVRLERPDDAFRAFETARRFGWSRALDIAFARLHLARGDRGRAADLLRPIAYDPHDDRTREEAAALLKEALR
jgi:Flp pilus assembly protein TadD